MNDGKGSGQNPFDILRNLGDLRDIRKLLGQDFLKNLPMYGAESDSQEADDGQHDAYPAIDLYDAGPEFILWASLPGLDRRDIVIEASPYHIVIRGRAPSLQPGREALITELFHGPFERDVALPARVKTDSARATFSQGVLRVVLMKYSPSETEINPSVPIDTE